MGFSPTTAYTNRHILGISFCGKNCMPETLDPFLVNSRFAKYLGSAMPIFQVCLRSTMATNIISGTLSWLPVV